MAYRIPKLVASLLKYDQKIALKTHKTKEFPKVNFFLQKTFSAFKWYIFSKENFSKFEKPLLQGHLEL
jgi:hypothetical protein